jgi:hypothetical protein
MKDYSLFDIHSILKIGDSFKIYDEIIIIFDVSPTMYNPNTFEAIKKFSLFINSQFKTAVSRSSHSNSPLPHKFLTARTLLLEINYKKKC